MEAIADPPAYHRARAAVRYDDIARTLVHALKYGDRLDLAPIMGRWMANAGRELLGGRRRARAGAAALAAAMGAALQPVGAAGRGHRARRAAGSVAHGALKRVKATPQQVGLWQGRARAERAGRFRVPADGKAEVAGRRLMLVDDVLTSGATVGRLRAGAVAGAAPPRRRAGVRAGCGGGPRSHIKRSETAQTVT